MCNLLRYKPAIQEASGVFEEISEVRIKPVLRYKVAPSEPAPVLSLREGRAALGMMEFGWRTTRGRQLMARRETVATLPMFRHAFATGARRCLVLAHGFYDSLDMGSFRQPWHIHLKGDGLMALAALCDGHPPGPWAFTLISAPANAIVARVIDRMPVILPPGLWRAWMDDRADASALLPMLQSFPADQMEAWPVTRRVNQRGYEAPDCIIPIIPEQGELDLSPVV